MNEKLYEEFELDVEDTSNEECEEDILEYDITSAPRDWNPSNIVELIDSNIIEMPLFQRKYVWDIKRASRFIESLILGLPVPELFVYIDDDEESTYKIIDGQQRILSIYFFVKGRFPKNNRTRNLIKQKIQEGKSFESLLDDNQLFKDFNLDLDETSRYYKKKFDDLEEMKLKFRLRRYVRAIMIRQNKPDDNKDSMYEIFNRLNTGGVKLTPQEIRASLYYCPFYDMMLRINCNDKWRKIIGSENLEIHSRDVELILRAFALLEKWNAYSPKMLTFLNDYSQDSKKFNNDKIEYCERLFDSFLTSCSLLEEKAFYKTNGKFAISIFEAVFVAVCSEAYQNNCLVEGTINSADFVTLKNNKQFEALTQSSSTSRNNVLRRIEIAKSIISLDKE